MRLLVCGGRDYANQPKVFRALDLVHAKHGVDCVIEGGAKGADTMAYEWAAANYVRVEHFPAKWREEGLSAGPRRNARMLLEGRPDVAVAFGGGSGTADMLHRCREANVPVWEIDH